MMSISGVGVSIPIKLPENRLQPAGGQASLIGKGGAGKVTINGEIKEVDSSDGSFFPSVSKDSKLS